MRYACNRQSGSRMYHNRDMSTFSDRVRQARKAAGMSQKQLAKAADISQTTVSDIERGRNLRSANTLHLAVALGVSAEWLATGAGQMHNPWGQPFTQAEVDDFLRGLRLDENARGQALEFAEGHLHWGADGGSIAQAADDLMAILDERYPGWRFGDKRPRERVDMVAEASLDALPMVATARQIPVVDYVEAGAPREIVDAYAKGDGHRMEWLDPASAEFLGPYTFALEIRGRSMEPDFREGEIIIVDPDACVRPGDVVVAKLNGDTEATVKKYRDRGRDDQGQPVYELVPLNPDYASITIDSSNPGTLIGPVVQHKRNLR